MDGDTKYKNSQDELPVLNHSEYNRTNENGTDSVAQNVNAINELPQLLPNENLVQFPTQTTEQNQTKKMPVNTITETPANKAETFSIDTVFKSTDWMVGVMFITFLMVVFTKVFFKDYLSSTIHALFDNSDAKKLLLKKHSQRYRISYIITFVFALNLSLFAVQLINHFNISLLPLGNFPLFLIFFIGILFFYMAKRLVINILGYILKKQKIFTEYTHNISLHNKAIGLVLFPFLISIPFIMSTANSVVVVLGIIIISGIYLLRVIRSLRIVISGQVSLLYTLLYVSLFEIAPLLVLFRAGKSLQSSDLVAQLLAML